MSSSKYSQVSPTVSNFLEKVDNILLISVFAYRIMSQNVRSVSDGALGTHIRDDKNPIKLCESSSAVESKATNFSNKCFTSEDQELMKTLLDGIEEEMRLEILSGMEQSLRQLRLLCSKLANIKTRDGSAYASLRKLGTVCALKMQALAADYKDELVKAVVQGNLDDLIILFKTQ